MKEEICVIIDNLLSTCTKKEYNNMPGEFSFYSIGNKIQFRVDKDYGVFYFNDEIWKKFSIIVNGNDKSLEMSEIQKLRKVVCDIIRNIPEFSGIKQCTVDYHLELGLKEFEHREKKLKKLSDKKLKHLINFEESNIINYAKEIFPGYDWLLNSVEKRDNARDFSTNIETIEDDNSNIINKNIKIQREWYIQSDDEFGLYIYTDYENNVNRYIIYEE